MQSVDFVVYVVKVMIFFLFYFAIGSFVLCSILIVLPNEEFTCKNRELLFFFNEAIKHVFFIYHYTFLVITTKRMLG